MKTILPTALAILIGSFSAGALSQDRAGGCPEGPPCSKGPATAAVEKPPETRVADRPGGCPEGPPCSRESSTASAASAASEGKTGTKSAKTKAAKKSAKTKAATKSAKAKAPKSME